MFTLREKGQSWLYVNNPSPLSGARQKNGGVEFQYVPFCHRKFPLSTHQRRTKGSEDTPIRAGP
jgi:hypothetical protein